MDAKKNAPVTRETKNKFMAVFFRYMGAQVTACIKTEPIPGKKKEKNAIWYCITTSTAEEYDKLEKFFLGQSSTIAEGGSPEVHFVIEPEILGNHARKIETLRKNTYSNHDAKVREVNDNGK